MAQAPTLHDVALRAGVSNSTVSRCFNHPDLVERTTLERVMAAAHDLGFAPNALARGLATGQSGIVGLIVPDITNPFFSLVARGCEDELRLHGLTLLLCNSDEQPDKEREIYRSLSSQHIDGLIYASNCGMPNHRAGHSSAQRAVPTVYIERSVDAPHVDAVYTDNESAGHLAAETLLRLGHRCVAVVTGFLNTVTSEIRLAAFRRRLAEGGVDLAPEQIIQGDFKLSGGSAAAPCILALQPRPTAIYTMTDLMAFGFLGRLAQHDVYVPQDISIISTDNLPISEFAVPALTTIHVPKYDLGREAARMLLSRLSRPLVPGRRKVLPVHLIERDSCRALA